MIQELITTAGEVHSTGNGLEIVGHEALIISSLIETDMIQFDYVFGQKFEGNKTFIK